MTTSPPRSCPRANERSYKRLRQRRQVWKFGLDPEYVGAFVGTYGRRLVEQAGPDCYSQKYLTAY